VSGLARHQWRLLAAILLVGDLCAVLAATGLATALTRRWAPGAHLPADGWLVALMAALALLGFASQGLYGPGSLMAGTREFVGLARGCVYASIALVLAGFVIYEPIPRLWTAVAWVLIAGVAGSVRLAVRRGAARLRRRGLFVERALLVGANQQSIGVAHQLSRPGGGFEVVGVLDDYAPFGTVLGGRFPVLGTPADLATIAEATGVHDAVVVPDALPWETMRRVLTEAAVARAAGRVHLSAGFHDLLTTGVQISERNHVPLLTLKRVGLTPLEATVKRGIDCALAGLLLVAFGPLLLLTVVRLRARGVPGRLRRRSVLGRRGRHFDLVTLPVEASRSAFVRKLPALVGVLRGDLSIVGPRPVVADAGGLGGGPTVRPGLTGLWREADTPTDQAVLDLYYIRNYSAWLDLHVLFVRVRARLLPWRRRARWPAGVEQSGPLPHEAPQPHVAG